MEVTIGAVAAAAAVASGTGFVVGVDAAWAATTVDAGTSTDFGCSVGIGGGPVGFLMTCALGSNTTGGLLAAAEALTLWALSS